MKDLRPESKAGWNLNEYFLPVWKSRTIKTLNFFIILLSIFAFKYYSSFIKFCLFIYLFFILFYWGIVDSNVLISPVHQRESAIYLYVVIQLLSWAWLCNPRNAAHQTPLSFIISWSLLKFMSIESVMLINHLILCRLVLLLPSVFPSIRIFSNESALRIR